MCKVQAAVHGYKRAGKRTRGGGGERASKQKGQLVNNRRDVYGDNIEGMRRRLVYVHKGIINGASGEKFLIQRGMINKWHIENYYRIVGAVGHAARLIWRWEFGGPNIRFVDLDVLEEVFVWVSGWLPMSRHGIGVLLHPPVPSDCSTIVAGEVILMEMR